MAQGSRGGGGGGTANVIVADIPERDLLSPSHGLKVWVIDATGDPTVTPNPSTGLASACYLYDANNTEWIKTAESESLDLPDANEVDRGISRIATRAEILSGSLDTGVVVSPKKLAEDAAEVLAGTGNIAEGGKINVDVDNNTLENFIEQINPGSDSSAHANISQHVQSKWGISNNAFMFVGSYNTSSGVLSSSFNFGANTISVSQSGGNGSSPSGLKYASTSINTGFSQSTINGSNSSRSFTLTGQRDIFGFYIWEVDPTGIGGFAFFEFKSSTGPYELRVWSGDPATDGQVGIKDQGVKAVKLNDNVIGRGLVRNGTDSSLEVAIDDSTTEYVDTVDTSKYSSSGVQSDENALWSLPFNSPGISWDGTYLSFFANGARFVEFGPGTTPIPIPDGDYYLVSQSTGINFQWAFGTLNNVSFIEQGQLSDGTYYYKSTVSGGNETAQGAKSSSGGTIFVRLASGNPQLDTVSVKDLGITLNKLETSIQNTLAEVPINTQDIDNLLPQHIHSNRNGFNVSQEAVESTGGGYNQVGNSTDLSAHVFVIDFKQPVSASGDQRILTQYVDAVSQFWGIILETNATGLQLLGGGSNSISNQTFNDGKWHTLVLSMNSKTVYIDGVSVRTNNNIPTNLNAPIAVAQWNGAFDFTHPIRNFRIFTGAGITATDIANYKTGSDIMANGTLVYRDIGCTGGSFGNFDFGTPSRTAVTAESFNLADITGDRIDDSVIGDGLKRNDSNQSIEVSTDEVSLSKIDVIDDSVLTDNTGNFSSQFSSKWNLPVHDIDNIDNNGTVTGVAAISLNVGGPITIPEGEYFVVATNSGNPNWDQGTLDEVSFVFIGQIGTEYAYSYTVAAGSTAKVIEFSGFPVGTQLRLGKNENPIRKNVFVKDGGIEGIKLADSVIGAGLKRNSTTQGIDVNTDDITIETVVAQFWDNAATTVEALFAFLYNFTPVTPFSFMPGSLSNGVFSSATDSGNQKLEFSGSMTVASAPTIWALSTRDISEFISNRIRFNGGTVYSFTQEGTLGSEFVWKSNGLPSGTFENIELLVSGNNPYSIRCYDIDPRESFLRATNRETWREDSGATVNVLTTDYGIRISGTDTGVVTVNLPDSTTLSDDQKFELADIGRSVGSVGAGTNNITILPGGSDTIINDPNFVMSSDDMGIGLRINKTYSNWELF